MKNINLLFWSVFLLVFSKASAQSAKETVCVNWIRNLDWEGVKQKAASEGKYIFLDCYATWCRPCNNMDQSIYKSEKICDFLNKKFLSVKLQFDTTNNDSELTRQWHAIARFLEKKYNVYSYPTFLFFSSSGKLVHYSTGVREVTEFSRLFKTALNPLLQNYTLLEKYRNGLKDYQQMPNLVKIAKEVKQDTLAKQIAIDYKVNYFDTLDIISMLTRKNVDLILAFPDLINSRDKIFREILAGNNLLDSLSYPGFSSKLIANLIFREEIHPEIWKNGKLTLIDPEWKEISKSIKNKYGDSIAKQIVSEAQLSYYPATNKWNEFVDLVSRRLKEFPPKKEGNLFGPTFGDIWHLNTYAWTLFLGCDNRKVLKVAVKWSDIVLSLEPSANYLDTKANLLYKIGKVKEAIDLEVKAINMLKNTANDPGPSSDLLDLFFKTLNKMRKGKATWK